MTTSADVLSRMVDDLQRELDRYFEEREALVEDYNDLLDENEALRDKVAELVRALNGSDRT